MSTYTWDEEQIKSTISDDRRVNSLLNEINNTSDIEMVSLFDRHDSFRDFKKHFRYDFITLARLDEDMLEYLFFLYEKVNLKDLMYIEMPHTDTPDDVLVKNVKDFYDSLEDKQISEEIETITNPDNHLLRIVKKDKTNNQTSDLVQGRVIRDTDTKAVYGSFYKRGTDEDTVVLAHEMGHMLAHRLFYDKMNPIMQKFLTEVESYYMELLAGQYLGEKYHVEKLALCFRANRLTKMIENAWDMHIQYIMNTYLLNVNYKTLSKQAKEDGYVRDITKEDYQKYIKIPFQYKAKMISSYLVALELFRMTLEDKEKGLRAYKGLFTSDIEDYKRLLNKYRVNYLLDDSTFNCMVEESKALKKVLSQM